MPDFSLMLNSFASVVRRKIERLTAKNILLLSVRYNSELIAIS